MDMTKEPFDTAADRISDEVVAILNAEIQRKTQPYAMLSGLCMGLLSFAGTAPLEHAPSEIRALFIAAELVVLGIRKHEAETHGQQN